MRPLTSIVLALLLAPSASFASPPLPACTRVLPGIAFPRTRLLEQYSTNQRAARRGRNGERGLVLVHYDHTSWTPFSLQLAEGDGTGGLALGPQTVLAEPPYWFSRLEQVVAGDFNGDGLDDVAVWWSRENNSYSGLEVDLGQPDGQFVAAVRWDWDPMLDLYESMATGDFDADGTIDLAFVAPQEAGSPYLALHLLGFDDVGQPIVRSSAPLPGYVRSMTGPVVVDWNADGIDDVVYLQSRGTWSAIGIALGDAAAPLASVAGDYLAYNVIQLRSLDRKLLALEGKPGPWYTEMIAIHQPYPGEYPCADAFRIPLSDTAGLLHSSIDLDGDGYQEMLASDGSGFDVYWGGGSGAPEIGPSSIGSPVPLAMFDLDGDGVRDVVFDDFGAVLQSRDVRFDEGLRGATVAEGWSDYPWVMLAIGDVDEDGLEDAITQTFWTDSFALARSKGDGSFDVRPFDRDPWTFVQPLLRDLDGDGHLDLAAGQGTRGIAWGRGDGTFGPWEVPPEDDETDVDRSFGDLDGDGVPDVIELVWYWRTEHDRMHLRTALGGARTWRETPVDEVLPRDEYPGWRAVIDVDGDGRDDLVLARRLSAKEQHLVWRRSLGDGSFAPPAPVAGSELPGPIEVIEVTDFDLDGTPDLFAQTGNYGDPPATYVSLRNAGAGRFERRWSSGPVAFHYEMTDRLADVDGDGRPDLVRGMFAPDLWPGYVLNIRRGDGLGGFLPAEPTTWAGPAGPMGRFRREGVRDVVRLHQRDWARINLELLPAMGHVLAADEAPPTVDVTLFPVIDTSRTPPRFDSRWRVATVPIDECDSSPRIVQRVVALLPLAAGATVTYRREAVNEVRVYEVPDTTRREVLLLGPNEAALRRAFDAARTAGGFAFEHFDTLQLESHESYGTERGARISGSRLAQRFVLDADRLVTALEMRPGDGLTFAVDATDAAGHRGTTRVRFDAVRDAATAKACANPELAPYLCVN